MRWVLPCRRVVGTIRRVLRRHPARGSRGISSRRLIASSGGRGTNSYSTDASETGAEIKAQLKISAPEVSILVEEFVQRSKVFKATGGVHSAALCDATKILLFSEDIGRHNAIDKIFGECLLKEVPTDDHIVVTSGRVSSEILLKVARRNIPILISKSAPTNLGVKLATQLGMTLIGFARGKRMNAYASSWRIVPEGE